MQSSKKIKLFISSLLIFTANYAFASKLRFLGSIRVQAEALDGVNKKAYGNNPSNIGRPDDRVLLNRLSLGFITPPTNYLKHQEKEKW